MPKKIDRLVKSLKREGYDESHAYAIAVKATGIRRKKGGGWTQPKRKKR